MRELCCKLANTEQFERRCQCMIGSNRVMMDGDVNFVFFGVVVEFYGTSGTGNSERTMDGRHVELYVVSGTENTY